jgi:hypothetical protein
MSVFFLLLSRKNKQKIQFTTNYEWYFVNLGLYLQNLHKQLILGFSSKKCHCFKISDFVFYIQHFFQLIFLYYIRQSRMFRVLSQKVRQVLFFTSLFNIKNNNHKFGGEVYFNLFVFAFNNECKYL